jgi:hypothetical protein
MDQPVYNESLSEQNIWGETYKVQGQLFILRPTYGRLDSGVYRYTNDL